MLVENLRHPSLRAKKYDQARDIWQARVTGSWRLYFRIEDDTYEVLTIHEVNLWRGSTSEPVFGLGRGEKNFGP